MSLAARLAILVALAGTAFGATPGDAGPDLDISRRHFEAGTSDYLAGRFQDAIAEFEAANRVRPAPAFDYNIGRCHDRLEEVGEAISSYERYLAAEPNGKQSREVRGRVDVLKQRLAFRPPSPPLGVSTSLSGSPPAPDQPGSHRAALVAPALVAAVAVGSLATGLGLYISAGAGFDRLKQSCAPDCASARWGGLQMRERAGVGLFITAGVLSAADIVLWVLRARAHRSSPHLAQAAAGSF